MLFGELRKLKYVLTLRMARAIHVRLNRSNSRVLESSNHWLAFTKLLQGSDQAKMQLVKPGFYRFRVIGIVLQRCYCLL